MKSIKIEAYGKLNLYLDITGKRDDGYHLLRTVMQSVSICDVLTFTLSDGDGIELVCDDPFFPKDGTNLICKAIEAYYKEAGVEPRGRITVNVEKNIPAMAGMAGGSADCAAALVAMNEFCGCQLTKQDLMKLAEKLGADVPFMLEGGIKLCEGIGEKLKALPEVNTICYAVVRPDVRISTPEAYKAYDSSPMRKKKTYASFEEALRFADAELMAKNLFNALEIAVNVPEINKAKEKLIACGALGTLMTGSGSAVFGIFENIKEAQYCIDRLEEYPFAKVVYPVSRSLEIIKRVGD